MINFKVPPNYSKNDFESVRSTLTWNLGNFPAGQLNRDQDNANFSCRYRPKGCSKKNQTVDIIFFNFYNFQYFTVILT